MALITLLRRDRVLSVPTEDESTEVVEVAYSTPTMLPRTVHLPLDLYRPATEEELAANPRYQMLPVDPAAEDQEKLTIETDTKAAAAAVPQTFELP